MQKENSSSQDLIKLEKICENSNIEIYEIFRKINDVTWAKILFEQPQNFPNILKLLPKLPSDAIQKQWNGASGKALEQRSLAFYQSLKKDFKNFSTNIEQVFSMAKAQSRNFRDTNRNIKKKKKTTFIMFTISPCLEMRR